MDLSTLSTEELDALQLAVNVEVAARLQRERAARRFAAVVAEAAAQGMSAEEIGEAVDTALVAADEAVEAKRRDAERKAAIAEDLTPSSEENIEPSTGGMNVDS
jgi:hypothetical protein